MPAFFNAQFSVRQADSTRTLYHPPRKATHGRNGLCGRDVIRCGASPSEVPMAAPISLRSDFDAATLRALAKRSRDPDQIRRLLALAAIYDGHARSEAARLAGVGLQIVRDWVMRFNDQGPDGLVNRKAPGRAPILDATKRAA